uniref:DDB1-and CUL4-associated factor 6 (Trinotate prediction) n=1 Tax=Myxobolus squamalis TaxID=59785 RepID=A0A6B2FX51_MYXSQ
MLKEAIFWGKNYLVAGSDCGHVFIWNRETDKVVQLLSGDTHIVNSLDHHPELPILACSGIDNTIKIFSPDVYSPTPQDEINRTISLNQRLLQNNQDFDISSADITIIFPLGED